MLSKHNKQEQKAPAHNRVPRLIRQNGYTSWGHQQPLSQRLRTTLSYVEKITLASLPSFDYQFRLNSLFDPNLTGTGHQPKGFDQMAALYNRYRVYRCKYRITFAQTSNAIPIYAGAAPTNTLTGFTDITDHAETNFSKWIVVVNSNPLPTVAESFSDSVDLAELNGKTRIAYASDDTTQALISANPAEQLNLHVMMQTLDNSTNVSAYFIIQLWYDCEFSDPAQLGQS